MILTISRCNFCTDSCCIEHIREEKAFPSKSCLFLVFENKISTYKLKKSYSSLCY